MLGKLLTGISDQIRKEFRSSLKNNHDYRRNSWNLPEKMQVYCSLYYLKAMFLLWCGAFTALLISEHFRPLFCQFAEKHLTGIAGLTAWTSSLLGSQVTLIGIVFPLVVGLISVLFQKKSSRIHIQSAYQLHSGFMFAGLSGLSLTGFILVEGLFISRGDKYLDTAFAVTAFIWMLFNIFLSIWFFITSLNVLDDTKRERLMLKYFHSHIVSRYLQDSIVRRNITYPGIYLGENKVKGIKIERIYNPLNKQQKFIYYKIKGNERVQNIYLRPLFFLLRWIKKIPGETAIVTLLPGGGFKNKEIALMSYSGVRPSRVWIVLFRLCFRTGIDEDMTEYRNIARGFYGEVYDTLEDKNTTAFEYAAARLVTTYSSLKNSFKHNKNGNYIDECETLNEFATLSQSFHFCFSIFCRDAVKTIETSGRYYNKVMDMPSQIYRYSEGKTKSDYQRCIESLFSVWHSLIDWRAGYGENLSVSQNQRYMELIISFIGKWEFSNRWAMPEQESGQHSYADFMLQHLCTAPRIVMSAATSDDLFATEHSIDMLLLWLSQTRLEKDYEAEHRWHSTFLTPSFLELPYASSEWTKILRGSSYSERTAHSIIFNNALTDIRLLIAGYFLTYLKTKNIPLHETVRRLLKSELAYPTGAHDRCSTELTTATDIIDSIIRIESPSDNKENSWYARLSGLIEIFSSYNERPIVTGRTYMTSYENIRDLYHSYATFAIMLSSSALPVSRRVRTALDDNLFSYNAKLQIIYQLQSLRYVSDKIRYNVLITDEQYEERGAYFNETLDSYIKTFSESMNNEIINTEIDNGRLRDTEKRLTEGFQDMLTANPLLSRFTLLYKDIFNTPCNTKALSVSIPRELMTRHVDVNSYSDFFTQGEVKRLTLNDLYNKVNIMQVDYTYDINDINIFCRKICELTVGNPDCTVIMFGTRFGRELRELIHHKERYEELGISMTESFPRGGTLPFRINNCPIYQVWSDNEIDHSLLIENSSFGEFRLFRYPDGSLFNTFWRNSDDNSLKGILTTLWDPEMELTGSVVARINHR
ncbi:hypothetical protein [Kosakonia cowanii]|uniref:hypothetical protein n=1 Tax=Kosakonia cowanii TaxID=208223 RepID=UPI0025A9ACB9|nr:hypothetical protein [Kosakonia cowanii]MDM9614619.1 hypothetical protein [Kosakonia cowanii]MDP4559816.1 hypothetical protein [Kosakonia cowanii]